MDSQSSPSTPAAPTTRPAAALTGTNILGPAAVTLGVAAITVAAIVAFGWLGTAPRATAHVDYTTTSITGGTSADHAVVLDPCSLDEPVARTINTPLVQRERVSAIAPTDRHRVTYQSGLVTSTTPAGVSAAVADCRSGLLAATVDQSTVDRRTLLPRADGVSREQRSPAGNGSSPALSIVDGRDGMQHRFPLGTTADRTYQVFDRTTRTVHEARYTTSLIISGLRVLIFDAAVSGPAARPVELAALNHPMGGQLRKPASWFPGLSAPSGPGAGETTARVFVNDSRQYYVEPRSGIIVNVVQRIDHTLRVDVPGGPGGPAHYELPYIRAQLSYDTTSIASRIAAARSAVADSHRNRIVVPGVAAGAGLVLIATGAWLTMRRRHDAAPQQH